MSGERPAEGERPRLPRSPVSWAVHNRVAANLLMFFFLLGGALFLTLQVRREVFPEAQLDIVTVTIAYPGATPGEVVEAVILPIEEAIRGVDGVDEISSRAQVGRGAVVAELEEGANSDQVRTDIESAVDRITSFPETAEEPVIALPTNQRQVLSLAIFGDTSRQRLDRLADEARTELLRDSRISRVEIVGIPPPEITIEVPQENLRRYGLTLPEVADRVRAATAETGAGEVETPGGTILLRVMEEREWAEEFDELAIVTTPGGVRVMLGDIATIRETFREEDQVAFFNGQPAVNLGIFRAAGQDPLATADAVDAFVERRAGAWGEGIETVVWYDFSSVYEDRINLLVTNGLQGLGLVLLILGIFLRPRLAFWVTLGLPVSFLGAFIFLPMLGASINMISLFAFILVLGIVVDDAIVVGEASFHEQRAGRSPLEAAVLGTHEVARPVIFSVTTTMLVFLPMLFIPGVIGEFFAVTPKVVITILAISLIESLIILPVHLAHTRAEPPRQRHLRRFFEWQQRFSEGFEQRVDRHYRPFLRGLLRWRYLVLVSGLAVLVLTAALYAGGRLRFVFFPDIEGTTVNAKIEMLEGTSSSTTQRAMEHVQEALRESLEQLEGEKKVAKGIFSILGIDYLSESDPTTSAAGGNTGTHLASVIATLHPADERTVSASELAAAWRESVGEVVGAQRILFSHTTGPSAGANLAFELALEDADQLEQVAERLAQRLRDYTGVVEVDKGFSRGKEELRFRLKPAARALGVTEQSLARQIRGAFFGVEALRQPRGTDELRVYVRLPKEDRATMETIDQLVIFTAEGQIPLEQAAELTWATSYTAIERQNGRRTIEVTADVTDGTSANDVSAEVLGRILPELQQDFPPLSWEVAGERQEQAETLRALGSGFALVFLLIFGLLATVFRSYVQPLLILLAIPFGIVGAVLGHALLGYSLSIVSVLGIIALAGVVVNDSLVYIDYVNRRRADGATIEEALEDGGVRRFRPILLTSLTTFFGLTPMILETSFQARFLIPMAISLGFGVIFVTPISLGLVPAAYRVLEDIKERLSSS